MADSADFAMSGAGFHADPYPHYHWLRSTDPVHWYAQGACWMLTRYQDVRSVLSDSRFIIGLDILEQNPALKHTFEEPFQKIIRTQILTADPPSHTRIRGILAREFSPARLQGMRVLIESVVDRHIDAALEQGGLDMIADFAYRVPFTIICELLGIPENERDPLSGWTHDLMRSTDPDPMDPWETASANAAAAGFRDFFVRLLARPTAAATSGLLAALATAIQNGTLTEEEMASNLILMFCAGHDTVVGLLGNGILALHRHPDQLAILNADPSLIRGAVDELLRFDTPVQIARRLATEYTCIGNRWISPTQYILCSLGAANRDPEVYANPDTLDVRRADIRPLSFGGGIHHCLGSQLARLEGEIAFTRLLARIPNLRLSTLYPQWNKNVFVRSIHSLPATC